MTAPIIAWWFAAGDTLPHGDGRKIVLGETHTVEPPLILCEHALHFCRSPWQALQFAPGPFLYQVRCEGVVVEDDEKGGCTERTYLAMRDTPDTCRAFARAEALRVIHLWDAPAVVHEYLETGREGIRDAAWDAARVAARVAAEDAAWDAAWAASGERFNAAIAELFA